MQSRRLHRIKELSELIGLSPRWGQVVWTSQAPPMLC